MKIVEGAVRKLEDEETPDSTQSALALIKQLQWYIASLRNLIHETSGVSDALSLALLNAAIEAVGRKEGWRSPRAADGLLSGPEGETVIQKAVRELEEVRKKVVGDISDATRELRDLEGSLQYTAGAIRYLERAAPVTEICAVA